MALIGAADQERLRERFARDDAAGAAAVFHADARLRDVPADAPDSRRAAAAVGQDHHRGNQLRPRAGQGETVRDRSRAGRSRSSGRTRRAQNATRRSGFSARRPATSSCRSSRPCCSSAARRRRCPPRASRASPPWTTPVDGACVHDADLPALSARRQRGARDGVRQPQHHGLRRRGHGVSGSRPPLSGHRRPEDRRRSTPATPLTSSRFSARCRRTSSCRRRSRPSVTSPSSSRPKRRVRQAICSSWRSSWRSRRCRSAPARRRPSPIASRFPSPSITGCRSRRPSPTSTAAPLELRMSRSSPGRYALHDFAKNVYDVHAAGAGRPRAGDRPGPIRRDGPSPRTAAR